VEFDPTNIVVSGVPLMLLVFGLVEFFKALFSLDGRWVTALSAALGAVLYALYQVQAYLPPEYGQVYTIVITSLAVGLAASGYYKFASARWPRG
jgi:hypothetical protein